MAPTIPPGSEANHVSFYDMINDLTREYDQVRARLGDLRAENAALRVELQRKKSQASSAGSTGRPARRSCEAGHGGPDSHTRCKEAQHCREPPAGLSLHTSKHDSTRLLALPLAQTSCSPWSQGLELLGKQEMLPKPAEPESPRAFPPDSPRSNGCSPVESPRALCVEAKLAEDSSLPKWTGGRKIVTSALRADTDAPSGEISPISPKRVSSNTVSWNNENLLKNDEDQGRPSRVSQIDSLASNCSSMISVDVESCFTEVSGLASPGRRGGHSSDSDVDDLPVRDLSRASWCSDPGSTELVLLPAWTKADKSQKRRASWMEKVGSEMTWTGLVNQKDPDTSELICVERYMMKHLIFRPSSRLAVIWDITTILVLAWDLIVIPLQAYQLPETGVWKTMEIVATVTWTVDMCFSFLKGYEVRGDIEMRPRHIAKHYLKTWFPFDVSIVGVDWVLFVLENGDLVDWLRFSRFRRMVRLLRLARLVKVFSRFVANLQHNEKSADGMVAMKLGWLMLMLVAINHFIACGWYAIGTMGAFEEVWISKAFEENDDFAYRYTTSFHWSVTQFTPASMEVTPVNSVERFYTIICIFFGLLMFSSFVSNMTSSMTHLTKVNVEKRLQRDILMNYMNSRKLSLSLRDDIVTMLNNTKTSKKGAQCEADVAVLKAMPQCILMRLHLELHLPVIERHALFQRLHTEEPYMVYRLCHCAMLEHALGIGEELFRFGMRCSRMYWTVNGECKYIVGFGDERSYSVRPQQWLCEAALWVDWEHRGQLTGKTHCAISQLDATEFAMVISGSMVLHLVQRYARIYAHYIEKENGGAEFATDIWGQRVRVVDLARKAFSHGEDVDADPAAVAMKLWSGATFTVRDAFLVWKVSTRRKKHWFNRCLAVCLSACRKRRRKAVS